jgi:hypothetical protein
MGIGNVFGGQEDACLRLTGDRLFRLLIRPQRRSLGAPPWAVVAAPIPLDFLLLWYVLRKLRRMLVAYVAIWAIYIVFQIWLSSLLHYDTLVPAWIEENPA